MRAEYNVFIDIEGVLHVARGVILRQIEQGEVVVIQLDLRPVKHGESHADQRVANQAVGLRHRVQAAKRRGNSARRGDVQRFLGKTALFGDFTQRGAFFRNNRLQRTLDLVGKGADACALLARELAHRAQNVGQRTVAPEHIHQGLLEIFGRLAIAELCFGFLAQLRERLHHTHCCVLLLISCLRNLDK